MYPFPCPCSLRDPLIIWQCSRFLARTRLQSQWIQALGWLGLPCQGSRKLGKVVPLWQCSPRPHGCEHDLEPPAKFRSDLLVGPAVAGEIELRAHAEVDFVANIQANARSAAHHVAGSVNSQERIV